MALSKDAEIQGLAITGVIYNDVEGEAWCEELIMGPPDLSCNSSWRKQLGNYCLHTANAAQALLREHVVLRRLQSAVA